MSRPGITKEQVADAVTALRAEGKPTTARVVRLQLGTGSYKTIGRFLDELGAKSTGKTEPLNEMPEAIQARLADCALSMWQAVCQATTSARNALTAQCEQRIHVLRGELVRERDLRKALERERVVNQQALSEATLQAQHLGERVAMLREQLAGEQAVVKQLARDREELLERLESAPRVRVLRTPRARANVGATRLNAGRDRR